MTYTHKHQRGFGIGSSPDALRFLECKTVENVRQIVGEVQVTGDLAAWQRFFLLPPGAPGGEQDVLMLASPNPLVAWAAASALRRLDLSVHTIDSVRFVYKSFLLAAARLGAAGRFAAEQIRWRATRVLSTTSDQAGLFILQEAAISDPSGSVRYGASRGVLERSLIGGPRVLQSVVEWCRGSLLQRADIMGLRGLVTGYNDARSSEEWRDLMGRTLSFVFQEKREFLSADKEWIAHIRKYGGANDANVCELHPV